MQYIMFVFRRLGFNLAADMNEYTHTHTVTASKDGYKWGDHIEQSLKDIVDVLVDIHIYTVYHTPVFSIIRCILSMSKNFLTYCHALWER